MVQLKRPLRPAAPEDAAALADLVNFASEGMALYVWRKIAGPDGDPWHVGRERAGRDTGSFSYRNGIVVDGGDGPIAALIGYRLPDAPQPIPETMPALFVPLQELENLAPGSWYVNVLAAYPEHRGKGYGGVLLAVADDLAAERATRQLSIIVSDANAGARRLYARSGYREVDRRPKVKESWRTGGTHWLLLIKQL